MRILNFHLNQLPLTPIIRSIGVSNFNVDQLKALVKVARVKPTVNQIRLHPYNWAENKELVEYATKHDIVIEAYSSLTSVAHHLATTYLVLTISL